MTERHTQSKFIDTLPARCSIFAAALAFSTVTTLARAQDKAPPAASPPAASPPAASPPAASPPAASPPAASPPAAPPPAVSPPPSSTPTPINAHPNFVEAGRFGVIGAITEDNWKGGLVYEHEHFEAQFFVHALFGDGLVDIDVSAKVGGRVPLGTLNYFAFGGEMRVFPGQKGSDVRSGSFDLGPYISLERYFAATPVMMCLWVNPVRYDHGVLPNPDGTTTTLNTWQVIRTGGFGLAYLF